LSVPATLSVSALVLATTHISIMTMQNMRPLMPTSRTCPAKRDAIGAWGRAAERLQGRHRGAQAAQALF
jgi:hypothetical protein